MGTETSGAQQRLGIQETGKEERSTQKERYTGEESLTQVRGTEDRSGIREAGSETRSTVQTSGTEQRLGIRTAGEEERETIGKSATEQRASDLQKEMYRRYAENRDYEQAQNHYRV